MTGPTFATVLDQQLRRDPGRPLVTFYDDATGERVELSVTTYANWVAKTAGLLDDELGLAVGDLLLVDLPTHWLGAVWLGAAWTIGCQVTTEPALATRAAAVVCGPGGVSRYDGSGAPVVALSLRPLGARFEEPLPAGVLDYGVVVWGQPDAYFAAEPPAPTAPAWSGDGAGPLSQGEVLAEAAAAALVPERGRLLTDVNPCTRAGLVTLLGPLQAGGGTVWVANPDEGRWAGKHAAERATSELRARQ